jgi:WD40 repeat protein
MDNSDRESQSQPTRALNGHTDGVRSLAFSTDGKKLASVDAGDTIRIWDIATGRADTSARYPHPVTCATFLPGTATILCGGTDGEGHSVLWIWDTVRDRKKSLPDGGQPYLKALAVSIDGKIVATSDRDTGHVKLWDPATWKVRRSLDAKHLQASALAFSPDGSRLVAVSAGTLRLWETQTGELVGTTGYNTNRAECIAFSPNGKTLAVGTGGRRIEDAGEVLIMDARTGVLLLRLPGHGGSVMCVAYSPDGKLLASGSWVRHRPVGELKYWDPLTGKVRGAYMAHKACIDTIAFSPTQHLLATASALGDGVINLWRVP